MMRRNGKPEPQIRNRATDEAEFVNPDDERTVGELESASVVMLFASAKYLHRDLHGPRPEGQRPGDLDAAAADALDALGRMWRAGYRWCDVAGAILAAEKRARKQCPATKSSN